MDSCDELEIEMYKKESCEDDCDISEYDSDEGCGSEDEDHKTLAKQIEDLCETSNLLSHRVDTMQRLLEMHEFNLETQIIKVGPFSKAKNVRKLLEALELSEEGLCVGDFLKALNRYLIQNELVDLNDLQIKMTPLLSSAFHKAVGMKKMPYALLLTALPKMFV
jgi:hypothetical protein